MSTLATFILANMERILSQWEKFASAVGSAEGMDRKALRNDAEWILTTIAHDMQTQQSMIEQEAKSKGRKPQPKNAPETAAEAHGAQRFASGFDLNEMVSEYRALRAGVIRLWAPTADIDARQAADELTRFNEGIDQALTESIRYFAGQLDQSRELFMGVLGHDLRTPLQVIQTSAQLLLRSPDAAQTRIGKYVQDSANAMSEMLVDLLDTARTQLGGSLPLQLQNVDMSAVCREVVSHFQVIHPERELLCNVPDQLHGQWDGIRIRQLLNNLLRNAFQHGSPNAPVALSLQLGGDFVTLLVHNGGDTIPPELLAHMFKPLRRGSEQRERPSSFSLGLGLYIAATITEAHRGKISVESTHAEGTTFRVTLPRHAVE